jgi:large subunit ribosomal protein L34
MFLVEGAISHPLPYLPEEGRTNMAIRRAFTTLRRAPTSSASLSQSSTASRLDSSQTMTMGPRSSILHLTRSFSALALAASPTRPSISLTSPPHSSNQALTEIRRLFSTTSALLGKRRRSDTYSPSRRVQKRRHGYLARMRTVSGRALIKRRIAKKRSDVSW